MMTGRWRIVGLTVLCAGVLVEAPATHHIMGIPHYAYDENYPQAPVITYKLAAGPYVMEMTGYPGRPVPEELTQMHAYIYRKDDRSQVFRGPVEACVWRGNPANREIVFGPVETRFEEKMHKFSPVYEKAGKYVVRMEMDIEGQPYEVDLPIFVGNPTSGLAGLGSWIAAVVFLLIAVRAIKIKRARSRAVGA